MSGILGVWNSHQPTPWKKMLDDLTVLGSDAKGDWHDREVGLSLGRAQFYNTPESSHEAPVVKYEGCILVWDGRLDERQSLLGGRSDSTTDAQLIIESYHRWGEDFLRHLTGEFVFILWDASRDLLIVGCDVVGGRTLAYYWDGRTLLLSSRVLTLLHHPQVSRELDELYLAHTICDFWTHPPGITPFAKIKRLRPGYALILKTGQLLQRQIAKLEVTERYETPKSPEIYYEKFWHLLNQSVKDRLRSYRPVCTTLSGGLDSTTVTVSLLNHLPTVDAFSTVTDIFPEFDERQPIQSFLQRYPQVKWHEVNGDDAWSLSEPWEQLPVTDDPLVTCTLPMNLQFMEQIQKSGFGLVFDGEGGDELFYSNIKDLARVGNWRQVLQQLKTENRWHSTLWNEFVLPHLPKYWQAKWFARWRRKSNSIPPWITPTYAQKTQTQAALQQYFQSYLPTNLVENITWAMESACSVGISKVYRLIGSVYQLETASPLQDQRLVEFALSLHPSLQHDLEHEKIFLRQANRSKLPEDVLWRPKNNYFDPIKYAGIGKGHQVLELLEQVPNCSCLQEIINVEQVESHLTNYRQDYLKNYRNGEAFRNKDANNLYALFSFIGWHQRLEKYLNKK